MMNELVLIIKGCVMKVSHFFLVTVYAFFAPAVLAGSTFPLWGDELREQGIELPLPYGISIGYMNQQDVTTSSNLRSVKVDGSEQALSTVDLGNSSSDTDITNVRFDVWVLPFLNVYAIGAKLEGSAITEMVVDMPLRIPDQHFVIEEAYEGDVFGLGMTFVYGYKNFIASLDVNYTETDLDLVASKIDTLLITPRIGYTSRVMELPYSIMLGASYMDLAQTLTIEQELNGQVLTTLLDTDTAKQWNTVVTAQLELDQHWQLILDAGFNDRDTLTGTLTYRF